MNDHFLMIMIMFVITFMSLFRYTVCVPNRSENLKFMIMFMIGMMLLVGTKCKE